MEAGRRIKVEYMYLEDPKQPLTPDNEWVHGRMAFSSNGSLEELRSKISKKTGIPSNWLRLSYKTSDHDSSKWFILKDEDDFEMMMMDGTDVVEIQAVLILCKKTAEEEDHKQFMISGEDQAAPPLSQLLETNVLQLAGDNIGAAPTGESTIQPNQAHDLAPLNRHEADLIKVIVDNIFQKTKGDLYKVADHPVGVDSHVEEVMKILFSKTSCDQDVVMVGIVGMGGIGKTTIAKSLFNQLSAPQLFDGSCFLQNTRENWLQNGGQDLLKQKLLSDILKVEVTNARGDFAIKQRLQQKRVLLVLDDIDSIEQLKVLAGDRDWFGKGSRIIITTRDLDLLIKHQVREDEMYRAKPFSDDQSLELFSFHAFRSKKPPADHKLLSELSKEFVATTRGLPLALKVLGSELFCAGDEGI